MPTIIVRYPPALMPLTYTFFASPPYSAMCFTVHATAAAASSMQSAPDFASLPSSLYSTATCAIDLSANGTKWRLPPVSPPPWNHTTVGNPVALAGHCTSRTHPSLSEYAMSRTTLSPAACSDAADETTNANATAAARHFPPMQKLPIHPLPLPNAAIVANAAASFNGQSRIPPRFTGVGDF